jgi:hypothetical protein
MDEQEYLANQELLAGANRRGNLHNTLAAVAAMSNNAGAAAAAKMAAADQQRQYGPKQLGNQGFMLPDTGAFVPSKIYVDEKNAAAEEKRNALAATIAAQKERDTQRAADKASEGERQRTLLLTIAGMRSADSRYKVDNAPAKNAAGKTLGASTINQLSEADGLAAGFSDLTSGFQDSYGGGYGSMAVQNFLGKNMPNSKYADQSNWWQGYNDQKNVIRNKLFGSALTASEKKAFDDANVTEGMTATQIRTKLAQQHAAAVRARNKLIDNYKGSGYDTSAFEDMPVPEHVIPGVAPTKDNTPTLQGSPAKVPAGVDPIVWGHMTPEQQGLWK